jgi:hypothetical protein
MPGAAPAQVASLRGSTALAPHFRFASGMRPSMSEIRWLVSNLVTNVKIVVDPVTPYSPRRACEREIVARLHEGLGVHLAVFDEIDHRHC